MTHEQLCNLLPEGWIERVEQNLIRKTQFSVRKAQNHDFIPYTTQNGEWVPDTIDWWTNGFWAAEMWQMYLMSSKDIYREEAVRAELLMDAALADFKILHHDVGFMWLIQSGVRYAIEKNQDSYDRTWLCAQLLAARFNPNGFIRAWNGENMQGLAIIDCMMNLPLLYWASRQSGDPRFQLIAMRHADTAMQHFVRADGSSNHQVYFDPMTGAYLSNPGGQGYESGSSWSRGQAWALYGFTLSYMLTGKKDYLDTAVRVANYFITCVQQTDWMTACDFRAPKSKELLDNAAGAIAACGLLELSKCLPEYQQRMYAEAACKLLVIMEKYHVDWTETQPAILTECASSYHYEPGHHMSMNYADYFFIEAVNKLRGEKMLFWAPDIQD